MKFTRPLFCGYKSMSFVWHIQVVTMAGHSRFRASRRLTVNFTCHQIGAMRAHRAQQRQPCAHWHRMHCEKMTKQIRTEKKLRKKESIERSTTEISHSDGSNTERQRGRKKKHARCSRAFRPFRWHILICRVRLLRCCLSLLVLLIATSVCAVCTASSLSSTQGSSSSYSYALSISILHISLLSFVVSCEH